MTAIPAGTRALLFDVDGTLYLQPPLRQRMLIELLKAHAVHPLRGWKTMRLLSAYRQAQERLRHAPHSEAARGELATRQIMMASEATGCPPAQARALVEQWMERAPLAYLGRYLRPDSLACLEWAKRGGIGLAAVSDYPAAAKLEALGLRDYFDVVISAQDADVQTFKPDPKSLLTALRRLQVSPSQAIYIGDRNEIDRPAAERAGVGFILLGGWGRIRQYITWGETQPLAQPLAAGPGEGSTHADWN